MKKLLAALAAALSLTFAFAPAMADVVTNNVVSGPYTQSTITNAVTANAAAQSILVGSSAGAFVGGVVIVGGLFPEMTTVTAIADGTHVTAIFRSNHEAGAAISFGGSLGVFVTSGSSIAATGAKYTADNVITAVVGRASAGIFYGLVNLSTTAQANLTTCYDNASTNSGQILYQGTLGAGMIITLMSGNGVAVVNGVTCIELTSITAPGFLILTN